MRATATILADLLHFRQPHQWQDPALIRLVNARDGPNGEVDRCAASAGSNVQGRAKHQLNPPRQASSEIRHPDIG
jgi:hypothetical protein